MIVASLIPGVSTRPYLDSDRAYLLSTMGRSVCRKHGVPDKHKRRFGADIAPIWIDHCGTIVIACASQDPDKIAGYALADNGCLYYVYVPMALRKAGIGRLCIELATGRDGLAGTRTVLKWPHDDARFEQDQELYEYLTKAIGKQ